MDSNPRNKLQLSSYDSIICVSGGEDRTGSYNIVEQYSPKTNAWAFVASMKRKRAGAGVAVCDGKIYVAGTVRSTLFLTTWIAFICAAMLLNGLAGEKVNSIANVSLLLYMMQKVY